jgi:uncharacterized Zn finger protein (UPF0148 family)
MSFCPNCGKKIEKDETEEDIENAAIEELEGKEK